MGRYGPTTNGLVGWWQFDEDSGTSTADNSGNGDTGTLQNSPTWTTGKYSGALDFSGTNQYVSVADANFLDLTNGSVAAWIKRDTSGAWHSIVAKGGSNNNYDHNYGFEIRDTNVLLCAVGDGVSGGHAAVLNTTATISTGTWYHVACTWDGSTMRIYINGAESVNGSQSGLVPAANTSPLYIGQFGGNTDRFDGLIDDVRVYNRALSAQEVADLYTGFGSSCP